MKTVLSLFILLVSVNLYSQEFNDRIYKKDGDTIKCKITKIERTWIYYDHLTKKGVKNDYEHISDIKLYTVDGKTVTYKRDSSIFMKSLSGDNYTYCQIVGKESRLTNKVTVSIDYGQEVGLIEDTRIRDESGKVINFNSMMGALNYMGSLGWELAQTYVLTIGDSDVYHFLLKRKN